MKKNFTFLIAALMLLTTFAIPTGMKGQTTHIIGWGSASGDPGTYTNFTTTSGSVEGVMSFTTAKNGSSTAPAYNSNASELRLYYNASGNGGSITITPVSGVTITDAVITTSTSPSVAYYVDGGSAVSVTASSNTYTISGISASVSLEIKNVNTSNTQLRIKTITLTYTSGSSAVAVPVITVPATFIGSTTAEITCETSGATIYYNYDNGLTWNVYSTPLTITETTTIYAKAVNGSDESAVVSATTTKTLPEPTVIIDATGITNTDVNVSTDAGSLVATVNYNSAAISGATVTWIGDNDAVATIDPNTGAVTLVAAGTVNFTATFAGNADYSSASATYEMTVTSSAPYMQPTNFDIDLNNSLFGTSYSGSVSGITDANPVFGASNNVTVTYAGSGNHYINNSQIRFYPNNKLTFEAPSGYSITKIVFTSAGTWAATISANIGTYTSDTKTWEGYSSSVLFTGSGSSRCDMSKVTITLAAPTSIATPTFSVASGSYTEVLNVTISCETTGATIYYTIDGTEPSAANGTQGTSVTISETTTLKAIAIKDNESSVVATAEYKINIFATIAAFKAAFNSTSAEEVRITGPLTTVYHNGGNLYVQDATGGMLVYDSKAGTAEAVISRTYENGQTVSNVLGTYTKYNGLVEFIPTSDFPAPGTGTVVVPTDITSLTSANYDTYESKLVRLSEMIFTADATLASGTATNVNMEDADGNVVVLRSNFKNISGSISSTDIANVTGFVTVYSKNNTTTYQLFPRDNNDVQMILGDMDVTTAQNIDFAAILESGKLIWIEDGGVLSIAGTFTNEGDIWVEDGGQLITSSAVDATVIKSITAANNWATASEGWYFIASPIVGPNGISPISADLITDDLGASATQATATYDLYKLDGDTWTNYRNSSFILKNGEGYLYANKNDVDLTFTGTINPNTSMGVEVKTGWNLVGNPFTYNAYVNAPHYVMTSTGTLNAEVQNSSVSIAPCTGVVVEATENGTVTFSKEAPAGSAKHGNIQIVLAQQVTTRGESNSEAIDNAVVSFNENSQLGKFNFGNQDARIYIPQNGKEFAIVSSEPFGSIPVNFRAEVNGSYTLNINVEDAEMNYLHLIDNMTGADVDLLANPSYTFDATNLDYESRFTLVFSNSNAESTESSEDFTFINNGNLIVAGTGTIQIVDMMGRVVNTFSTNDHINTNSLANGVYVIRLINGENVKTQKIVVK